MTVDAETKKNESGRTPLFLVLDAQREAVLAVSSFFRAVVDYEIALMNVHHARGTLLDNYRVYLSEGPWSDVAHTSAARLANRFRERRLNYCFVRPPNVSVGAYEQETSYVDDSQFIVPEGVPTPATRDDPEAVVPLPDTQPVAP